MPNVAKLVTTRIPLADAADAFETLIKGKDAQGNMVLKIVRW
jgi:threonine dehydrogenase-like Zn-dependent dehydrogenase